MTERAWVLSLTGSKLGIYLGPEGDAAVDDLRSAVQFDGQIEAEAKAQNLACEAGRKYGDTGTIVTVLHAIPIERETVQVVEETTPMPSNSFVLRFKDHQKYAAVDQIDITDLDHARILTATELFRSSSYACESWTPIPVRVTETPGKWREVADD